MEKRKKHDSYQYMYRYRETEKRSYSVGVGVGVGFSPSFSSSFMAGDLTPFAICSLTKAMNWTLFSKKNENVKSAI